MRDRYRADDQPMDHRGPLAAFAFVAVLSAAVMFGDNLAEPVITTPVIEADAPPARLDPVEAPLPAGQIGDRLPLTTLVGSAAGVGSVDGIDPIVSASAAASQGLPTRQGTRSPRTSVASAATATAPQPPKAAPSAPTPGGSPVTESPAPIASKPSTTAPAASKPSAGATTGRGKGNTQRANRGPKARSQPSVTRSTSSTPTRPHKATKATKATKAHRPGKSTQPGRAHQTHRSHGSGAGKAGPSATGAHGKSSDHGKKGTSRGRGRG